MKPADCQPQLQQPYRRENWQKLLPQLLPGVELFSQAHDFPLTSESERGIATARRQFGAATLADGKRVAFYEIEVAPDVQLQSNRVGLRSLIVKCIDEVSAHAVLAFFVQPGKSFYRLTYAAKVSRLGEDQKIQTEQTAPRRFTYILGEGESCRTAAGSFDLLARKGEAATIADVRAAFDKEPLTREFFKRFELAIEAVKTDLEKHHALPSAQAYSRAQLLLERLLFLYFVQNRGWLDQKRNYLLDKFQSHRVIPNEFTYYADFLERVFFTLSTPPDFKGPGAGVRLPGLPFLNGGLFDDDEFAQTHERKKDNPPLRIRNATFADVFENLLEAFNFTAHEDTPIDQDVAVDPEMLGKVFESIVLHAEAADPDAVAPDTRRNWWTPSAGGWWKKPNGILKTKPKAVRCRWTLGASRSPATPACKPPGPSSPKPSIRWNSGKSNPKTRNRPSRRRRTPVPSP